ncbi:TIGR02587 family membrane protein [Pontibacter sp. 172403-2]|uniref:TIGR02587 family membrane protein n=1 Tax=Pontibacter rufus TaxID=2791028 RepID=UPI0018AF9525|nr:TIGR02587 family membrane protein [Pontibacter sp. 172403-2]MBF9254443.1 TIGR02587 family membrane protein [Pontibacter sp. 172403-2]
MKRPVYESLKDYARGIAGGLLFSFPLLYTMEMWWAGLSATSLQLIILILITYLLLLGYNRFAGMRPDATWGEVAIDSVEEMGIGLVISFGVLLMIRRIDPAAMGLTELLGKTIIEAMAVSIGVSIGKSQLDSEESGGGKQPDGGPGSSSDNGKPDKTDKLGMAVLAICGAVVVGGNVAPTEEILVISLEAKPIHVLMMAVVSLLLSIVIVYFSDFRGATEKFPKDVLYHITFDTCVCYLMALGTSAFILWFFGRFEDVSFWVAFAQCIVLGVIATLGASAGRLLIK